MFKDVYQYLGCPEVVRLWSACNYWSALGLFHGVVTFMAKTRALADFTHLPCLWDVCGSITALLSQGQCLLCFLQHC